jgi:hypothetical protein
LQRRLGDLIAGYDGVARGLEGRSGRWHAIIQVQSEVRAGKVYYRKPEAAEIELQVGLALSRGASGIVYFLYSSGVEELLDGAGDLVETRVYEGLVDIDGAPTASYRAVRRLNGDLKRLSTALQDLHFHGALSTEFLLSNDLLLDADEDLEFGLFGDGSKASHLLVVNRQTHGGRHVRLRLMADDVVDAVAGEALAVENGRVTLELAAGASRLLHVVQRSE